MKIFINFHYIFAIFAFTHLVQSYLDIDIILTKDVLRSISDNMTKYINDSIDPCDDFYEYACGNWSRIYKSNKINEKITVMNIYDKKLQDVLKDLLKEPKTTNDVRAGVQVKKFYTSCIQTDYDHGTRQIIEFLKNEGGMPELNQGWNEKTFNWQHTIRKLKSDYGFDILIGAEIANDFQNVENNKLYIGEIQLSELPKHYYFQLSHSDKLDRYRNKIVKNLKKLGMDVNKAKRLAREFVDLERDILKDSTEYNENNILTAISVSDLQYKHPSFSWSNFISSVLHYKPMDNIIVERNSKYIESVLNVINNTSKRRIANYIMWKAAQYFMENSLENYDSRESYCVEITKKYFPEIINFMLAKKYKFMVNAAQYKIDEITLSIKNSLKDFIKNNTWLPEHLKNMITSKTERISVKLLKYFEDDLESNNFRSVELNEHNFFNNTIHIMRFKTNNWRNKIHPPVEIAKIHPLDINTYYIPATNEILIPIRTIFYPFFHVNYPRSMNFGRIGVLIANALMQAVDPDSYVNTDRFQNFWDEDSRRIHYNKRKCFDIEAIANPMIKFLPEDEPFSYSNAIDISFNAYLLWLKEIANNAEVKLETLPAFDFTNTQLFFITYTQNWCKSIYDDQPYDGVTEILPSLVNFNDFSREFNCQQGSWMNPQKKCSVWNNL